MPHSEQWSGRTSEPFKTAAMTARCASTFRGNRARKREVYRYGRCETPPRQLGLAGPTCGAVACRAIMAARELHDREQNLPRPTLRARRASRKNSAPQSSQTLAIQTDLPIRQVDPDPVVGVMSTSGMAGYLVVKPTVYGQLALTRFQILQAHLPPTPLRGCRSCAQYGWRSRARGSDVLSRP